MTKRIDERTQGVDLSVKYTQNPQGDFEIWVDPADGEDTWTYSHADFVRLDEPVILRPPKK